MKAHQVARNGNQSIVVVVSRYKIYPTTIQVQFHVRDGSKKLIPEDISCQSRCRLGNLVNPLIWVDCVLITRKTE